MTSETMVRFQTADSSFQVIVLPPTAHQYKTHLECLVSGRSAKEQLTIIGIEIFRWLKTRQKKHLHLVLLHEFVAQRNLFQANFSTLKDWIGSISGFADALNKSAAHMKTFSDVAEDIHRMWQLWPWDIVLVIQQPKTWSRDILRGFHDLARAKCNVADVKAYLGKRISYRSGIRCEPDANMALVSREPRLIHDDLTKAKDYFGVGLSLSTKHFSDAQTTSRGQVKIPDARESSEPHVQVTESTCSEGELYRSPYENKRLRDNSLSFDVSEKRPKTLVSTTALTSIPSSTSIQYETGSLHETDSSSSASSPESGTWLSSLSLYIKIRSILLTTIQVPSHPIWRQKESNTPNHRKPLDSVRLNSIMLPGEVPPIKNSVSDHHTLDNFLGSDMAMNPSANSIQSAKQVDDSDYLVSANTNQSPHRNHPTDTDMPRYDGSGAYGVSATSDERFETFRAVGVDQSVDPNVDCPNPAHETRIDHTNIPDGSNYTMDQCRLASRDLQSLREGCLTDTALHSITSLLDLGTCFVMDSLQVKQETGSAPSAQMCESAAGAPIIFLPYHDELYDHWSLGVYRPGLNLLMYFDPYHQLGIEKRAEMACRATLSCLLNESVEATRWQTEFPTTHLPELETMRMPPNMQRDLDLKLIELHQQSFNTALFEVKQCREQALIGKDETMQEQQRRDDLQRKMIFAEDVKIYASLNLSCHWESLAHQRAICNLPQPRHSSLRCRPTVNDTIAYIENLIEEEQKALDEATKVWTSFKTEWQDSCRLTASKKEAQRRSEALMSQWHNYITTRLL
ncbi:MAG: hypothetical protein Q9218_003926 [Villophora microphyllina]